METLIEVLLYLLYCGAGVLAVMIVIDAVKRLRRSGRQALHHVVAGAALLIIDGALIWFALTRALPSTHVLAGFMMAAVVGMSESTTLVVQPFRSPRLGLSPDELNLSATILVYLVVWPVLPLWKFYRSETPTTPQPNPTTATDAATAKHE